MIGGRKRKLNAISSENSNILEEYYNDTWLNIPTQESTPKNQVNPFTPMPPPTPLLPPTMQGTPKENNTFITSQEKRMKRKKNNGEIKIALDEKGKPIKIDTPTHEGIWVKYDASNPSHKQFKPSHKQFKEIKKKNFNNQKFKSKLFDDGTRTGNLVTVRKKPSVRLVDDGTNTGNFIKAVKKSKNRKTQKIEKNKEQPHTIPLDQPQPKTSKCFPPATPASTALNENFLSDEMKNFKARQSNDNDDLTIVENSEKSSNISYISLTIESPKSNITIVSPIAPDNRANYENEQGLSNTRSLFEREQEINLDVDNDIKANDLRLAAFKGNLPAETRQQVISPAIDVSDNAIARKQLDLPILRMSDAIFLNLQILVMTWAQEKGYWNDGRELVKNGKPQLTSFLSKFFSEEKWKEYNKKNTSRYSKVGNWAKKYRYGRYAFLAQVVKSGGLKEHFAKLNYLYDLFIEGGIFEIEDHFKMEDGANEKKLKSKRNHNSKRKSETAEEYQQVTFLPSDEKNQSIADIKLVLPILRMRDGIFLNLEILAMTWAQVRGHWKVHELNENGDKQLRSFVSKFFREYEWKEYTKRITERFNKIQNWAKEIRGNNYKWLVEEIKSGNLNKNFDKLDYLYDLSKEGISFEIKDHFIIENGDNEKSRSKSIMDDNKKDRDSNKAQLNTLLLNPEETFVEENEAADGYNSALFGNDNLFSESNQENVIQYIDETVLQQPEEQCPENPNESTAIDKEVQTGKPPLDLSHGVSKKARNTLMLNSDDYWEDSENYFDSISPDSSDIAEDPQKMNEPFGEQPSKKPAIDVDNNAIARAHQEIQPNRLFPTSHVLVSPADGYDLVLPGDNDNLLLSFFENYQVIDIEEDVQEKSNQTLTSEDLFTENLEENIFGIKNILEIPDYNYELEIPDYNYESLNFLKEDEFYVSESELPKKLFTEEKQTKDLLEKPTVATSPDSYNIAEDFSEMDEPTSENKKRKQKSLSSRRTNKKRKADEQCPENPNESTAIDKEVQTGKLFFDLSHAESKKRLESFCKKRDLLFKKLIPLDKLDSSLMVAQITASVDEPELGLFATVAFKKGELITQYCGEEYFSGKDQNDKKKEIKKNDGTYVITKLNGDSIDAGEIGSVARFINDAENPNCETVENEKGEVLIIATRKIFRGEELTMKYERTANNSYWNEDNPYLPRQTTSLQEIIRQYVTNKKNKDEEKEPSFEDTMIIIESKILNYRGYEDYFISADGYPLFFPTNNPESILQLNNNCSTEFEINQSETNSFVIAPDLTRKGKLSLYTTRTIAKDSVICPIIGEKTTLKNAEDPNLVFQLSKTLIIFCKNHCNESRFILNAPRMKDANAKIKHNKQKGIYEFIAIKEIKPGDQIMAFYNDPTVSFKPSTLFSYIKEFNKTINSHKISVSVDDKTKEVRIQVQENKEENLKEVPLHERKVYKHFGLFSKSNGNANLDTTSNKLKSNQTF